MLNFRPITEPFIKLCGDMAEEIKQLKYENAELKEMLENTRHDLFYTRGQNRFLSESLADLQREKRKDRERKRNRGVLPDKSNYPKGNNRRLSEKNRSKQTHKYDSGEFDPGSG